MEKQESNKTETPIASPNLSVGLSCPSMIRNALLKQDWSERVDGTWYNALYGKVKYYTWEEAAYNQIRLAR